MRDKSDFEQWKMKHFCFIRRGFGLHPGNRCRRTRYKFNRRAKFATISTWFSCELDSGFILQVFRFELYKATLENRFVVLSSAAISEFDGRILMNRNKSWLLTPQQQVSEEVREFWTGRPRRAKAHQWVKSEVQSRIPKFLVPSLFERRKNPNQSIAFSIYRNDAQTD